MKSMLWMGCSALVLFGAGCSGAPEESAEESNGESALASSYVVAVCGETRASLVAEDGKTPVAINIETATTFASARLIRDTVERVGLVTEVGTGAEADSPVSLERVKIDQGKKTIEAFGKAEGKTFREQYTGCKFSNLPLLNNIKRPGGVRPI